MRAYLLFEVDTENADVSGNLRGMSLGNCLQLVESLVPGEVLCHLHCDENNALNAAMAELSSVQGVKRSTFLAVIRE